MCIRDSRCALRAGYARPRSRYARCGLALAGGAGILQLAAAAALRTGQIEAHGAGHLGNRAGPVAFRAGYGLAAGRTASVAGGTRVVAGDIEPRLRALDGLPEIDIQRVLEILALLRRLLRPFAAVEEVRKDIDVYKRQLQLGEWAGSRASRG